MKKNSRNEHVFKGCRVLDQGKRDYGNIFEERNTIGTNTGVSRGKRARTS